MAMPVNTFPNEEAKKRLVSFNSGGEKDALLLALVFFVTFFFFVPAIAHASFTHDTMFFDRS